MTIVWQILIGAVGSFLGFMTAIALCLLLSVVWEEWTHDNRDERGTDD